MWKFPLTTAYCQDYLKERCRLFAWQKGSEGKREEDGVLCFGSEGFEPCQTSFPFATYHRSEK